MRICLIGNADIYTEWFSDAFKAAGHETHLITWTYNKDPKKWDGTRVHYLGGSRPYLNKWLLPITALRVKKILDKIQPDIVNSHYLLPNAFYAAFGGHHPHVASIYGSDIYASNKSPLYPPLLRYSLSKADVLLTTSQQMSKDICSLGFADDKKRIEVIPWGIDTGLFYRRTEKERSDIRRKLGLEGKFVVVNPRGIRRDISGFTQSIHSMKKVLEKVPNAMLILLKGWATDAEYEKEILNLAARLNISDKVKYIDRPMSPEEMAELLNASDALLSIPPSDQFSTCIQEAMAIGVIPIVSKLKVYGQYLEDGHNAFFVSRNETAEIANAIITCAHNPDLTGRYYSINRKIIEEQEDWCKNSRRIIALFENLLPR